MPVCVPFPRRFMTPGETILAYLQGVEQSSNVNTLHPFGHVFVGGGAG